MRSILLAAVATVLLFGVTGRADETGFTSRKPVLAGVVLVSFNSAIFQTLPAIRNAAFARVRAGVRVRDAAGDRRSADEGSIRRDHEVLDAVREDRRSESAGSPTWPAFGQGHEAHLELGRPIQAGTDLNKAKLDFFERVQLGRGARQP
ncbi:MAG TPA: hypothetical protein VNZ26_13035 [Vicinamibacterales bacterium]|jgi:hypothetical protein|nr:hypothetical protein [Vicinamibacterales bacterium]